MSAWPVVALYVDPKGPYREIAADWFDQERDATTYEGPLPVVAHPPCGPWGKLAWRCTEQDRELGIKAVDQVRRFGGVLEHPIGSRLFEECGIFTTPWTEDRQLDRFGGYTIRVRQWDYTHRGEKDTVLYVVGTYELPPLFECLGRVDAPRPIERMGKLERRLTPEPFAWWLCNLASRCRRVEVA